MTDEEIARRYWIGKRARKRQSERGVEVIAKSFGVSTSQCSRIMEGANVLKLDEKKKASLKRQLKAAKKVAAIAKANSLNRLCKEAGRTHMTIKEIAKDYKKSETTRKTDMSAVDRFLRKKSSEW